MKYGLLIFTLSLSVFAETLFEVKDSANNKVLDISTDGLRVMNQGDTLMVISSNEIKANISSSKGLSRTFSVTTNSAKGSGIDLMRLTSDSTRFWISDEGSGFGVSSLSSAKEKSVATDFLRVSNSNTEMREGTAGNRYTDFSPENMFLGLNAGIATTPTSTYGRDNIFIGNNAGLTNYNGRRNIFIGPYAGNLNYSGHAGVFLGYYAGYKNTGSGNIFLGSSSGYENTTGYLNTYVGNDTGFKQASGYYNVYMGYGTGYNKTSGNNNVILGSFAGTNNSTGSGNVFIGQESGYYETGSNKLYIDNSNTASPLIYGDFGTNNLVFNTSKVYVKHASGMSNGLYIQNSGYSNYWHFYQYSTGGLHLYYNGIQRGSWNSTTGAYTSYSKEAKDSVEDLDRVTNKIMKLQPKKFNFTNQKSGEMKHIGLIAQEVKEIFPSLVVYNEETDTHGMDYSGFGVLAIKAIQEQQEIIGKLKNENADLKTRLERLEKLILK